MKSTKRTDRTAREQFEQLVIRFPELRLMELLESKTMDSSPKKQPASEREEAVLVVAKGIHVVDRGRA